MNQVLRLPSYDSPPVTEVVASVQFDPIPNFNIVQYGRLWDRFRKQFPVVEQKAPIASVVERLGVRAPLNQIQFQIGEEMELPRLWFVNDSGDELLQLQQDRFIRNWRAMPKVGNPYPRYERHIRPKFIEDFRVFEKFLSDEMQAKAEPNQCELTYINHILPNEHWKTHRDLAAVFRGWTPDYLAEIDHPVESINFRITHILNDANGEFVGRLHVLLQSAFRAPSKQEESEQPIFALTLTTRGRPLGEGLDGILGFFDLGRRAIVSTFDSMTTPQMHKEWGKKYDS